MIVYQLPRASFFCCCLPVIMWFLFGEVSSSSGCLGLGTLLAHLSRRLIVELIVYTGIRRPSVRQHFQTTSPLKQGGGFFPYSTYSIYRKGEQKVMFFYSGRIRTLVAMANYISHRLIMGKVEIYIFFCLNGDIWNFLLQKCLLSSSPRFI